MVDPKNKRVSTLANSGIHIRCTDPDVGQLKPDELNALHLCKNEMLAAVHRLYFILDPPHADPILRKYLQKLLDETK